MHKLESLDINNIPQLISVPTEHAFRALRSADRLYSQTKNMLVLLQKSSPSVHVQSGRNSIRSNHHEATVYLLATLTFHAHWNCRHDTHHTVARGRHAIFTPISKTTFFGNLQLTSNCPKMQTITGRRLERMDVSSLQSVRGYEVHLAIIDTQLSILPETIFRTLDQVTILHLNVANNMLTTLEPFLHT
jgi:hypothetical protein